MDQHLMTQVWWHDGKNRRLLQGQERQRFFEAIEGSPAESSCIGTQYSVGLTKEQVERILGHD